VQTSEFYSSDQKTFWRGWVWNRLQERIPTLERRQATVLYLVGPHDYDREAALKKGFSNQNLIAVDTCRQYVKNVREQKNLAIQGRLQDVLAMWPEDWKIDAVVADFTCGLDQQLIEFQMALISSQAVTLGKTVVAINLQRGRDANSNSLRQDLVKYKRKYKNWVKKDDGDLAKFIDITWDEKHRAKQLFVSMFSHCLTSVKEYIADAGAYCKMFHSCTNPIFNSYRQSSSQPYMDSVVFTVPPGERDSEDVEIYIDYIKRNLVTVKNRISALRAVRTMKIQKINARI
jgi:hypothetical protein